MSTKSPYSKPEYFYNRELSWLLFNRRVLEEAKDSSLPLFDRLKFLSITSSNLDEFFMIRVASLKDMVQVKYNKKDISGMTPAEQLAAINERTHLFVKDQYDIFNRSLIPALEKEGVHVLSHYENLSDKQSKYVDRYFTDEVYPVLTPMAVDSSRPFPLIRNKTLNIGAILRMKKDKAAGGQFRDLYLSHGNKKKGADSNDTDFATVQVPSVLPRFVEIPSEQKGEKTFILLEQIIEKNIGKLFVNYEIESVFPYRA